MTPGLLEASSGRGSFRAAEVRDDGKYHLLLACSGSVASIKLPNILHALQDVQDLSIRVILTRSAMQFLQGQSSEQPDWQSLQQAPNVDALYHDVDEWNPPWTRNAPILHIELRRWADSLWVVPLSANTLTKVSVGMSDNLLTSVVRAWQVVDPAISHDEYLQRQRFIFLAPAMNTAMWKHPLTGKHLADIESFQNSHGSRPWIRLLRPQEKALACGDVGDGAMRDWQLIVQDIQRHMQAQGRVRHLDP